MLNHSFFLSWIHWNPPRVAFTIPILGREVAWYGILFSLGFILGFFLIIPIFQQRLKKKELLERDILHWSSLIIELASHSSSMLKVIFDGFSSKIQAQILEFKIKQEPSDALKQEILLAFGRAMKDPRLQLSRDKIEQLFPKAIRPTRELSLFLTDRITWFVIAGTLIGARLGHVFFYEWPRYQSDLLGILKVWEGGLASHGGTVGIMLALFFYLRSIRKTFPEFEFVDLLDILTIPTAAAAVCIRLGNFINQEILGTVTTMPWGVVFGNPYDGSSTLPRHPAQLYEAIAYFITFCTLYFIWRKNKGELKKGTLIGLFMLFVFGSRILVEWFKTSQSLMIEETFMSTGQYLSIPFVIMGLAFLFRTRKKEAVKVS